MARRVDHEITMIAWAYDREAGAFSVLDIVETSRHFASHFARTWARRMPEVAAISAVRPNGDIVAARRNIVARA